VDGVVLKVEGRTATFLPQVWERVPDAESFLDALAQKAMVSASAWREPDAVVQTYQAESFAEAQAGG
jgi:AMMECR1 domain-containing protein